jgi:hypothetical protein
MSIYESSFLSCISSAIHAPRMHALPSWALRIVFTPAMIPA